MINQAQVQHIAHLARLQLSTAEQLSFATQLDSIFNYFEQLNQLDPELVDVLPTARAIPMVNVTRPDQAVQFGDREVLLNGAPEREQDFFRVPQIMQ